MSISCTVIINGQLSTISVAEAWSVESLPPNSTARVRFPVGVRNFNFCPGIGRVMPFVMSCVVSGGGPDTVLTTHSGRPALVFWSKDCSRSGLGFDPRSGKVPWVRFFGVFPHLSDKCQEAFGPQGLRISFGRHYHYQSSFITGANDLRC